MTKGNGLAALVAVAGALFAAVAAAAPSAADASQQLSVSGGARLTVHYACENGRDRTVVYVNGEPDHLAVVPVDGGERIFVNVIAASGARYAAGQYIWWTKGNEAWLYDVMKGQDGKPVLTCRERGPEGSTP